MASRRLRSLISQLSKFKMLKSLSHHKPVSLNNPKIKPIVLGWSMFTLLGFKENTVEDDLIKTIKHCILFIQLKEYVKAEQLLHIALRQAEQIRHEQGVTFIYDVMANLALEREEYSKAKQLFVSVSQRLMASGVSEDDERVVHVSMKLARISHMTKEYNVAQLGYEWCLEKLNKAFERDPNNENINKLLALLEDWYGRLFVECNKQIHGLNFMTRALERMKTITDIDQHDVVQQYNDLGTICYQLDRVDESISYLNQAIAYAKQLDHYDHLGIVHVNLGRAYLSKSMMDEARKHCGYGWRLGHEGKIEDIKKEAEDCLLEIKNSYK